MVSVEAVPQHGTGLISDWIVLLNFRFKKNVFSYFSDLVSVVLLTLLCFWSTSIEFYYHTQFGYAECSNSDSGNKDVYLKNLNVFSSRSSVQTCTLFTLNGRHLGYVVEEAELERDPLCSQLVMMATEVSAAKWANQGELWSAFTVLSVHWQAVVMMVFSAQCVMGLWFSW